ncbi:MAG TPA: hypothetical protein VFB74_23115 [Kribbellaceae bacterium]|nr:hypothetical protein [Kribbellaceae bacterium]
MRWGIWLASGSVVAALVAGGGILAVGDDDASPKMDKQQMLQLGDTCTAAVRRQLHPREVELTERTEFDDLGAGRYRVTGTVNWKAASTDNLIDYSCDISWPGLELSEVSTEHR